MRLPHSAPLLLLAFALAACGPQAPAPQAAASGAAHATPAASQAAPAAATEAQVKALLQAQAERWDRAIVAKRREDIASNMAADFRQIDGQGSVEDRAGFLEGLMDPQLQIDPYQVEDFEIRLYGDVALLSGRTRMSGRYGGKAFHTHYRYIDIYVKRQGEWKIVSVQISKLPPDAQ